MARKPAPSKIELPGQEALTGWKMKNFSPAFDHDKAMAYRETSKQDFLDQADRIYDSILRMTTKKP